MTPPTLAGRLRSMPSYRGGPGYQLGFALRLRLYRSVDEPTLSVSSVTSSSPSLRFSSGIDRVHLSSLPSLALGLR